VAGHQETSCTHNAGPTAIGCQGRRYGDVSDWTWQPARQDHLDRLAAQPSSRVIDPASENHATFPMVFP
jgi:hypothetical protein